MTSIRPLVFCLALAAAAPIAVFPTSPAMAQDAADEAPGLAAILPVPWAVADGETKIRIQVVLLSESGKPISGADMKPEVSAGQIADGKEVGPGLYRFVYTPPKSEGPVDVTVTVKAKAGKGSAEASRQIRLSRDPVPNLAGTTNPEGVVLGKDTDVTLSITGGPPKGDLVVRNTTSGKVSDLTNMGGGKFTARFQTPKENFPQLGIITLANAANPIDEFGYIAVPLNGAVDYPVEAIDGASVLLKVAGKEYGPVKADGGKAKVPIIVPPGINKATQVTVVSGESTEKELDLRVPDTVRVKAIATARAVPADSEVAIPIRVVVLTPEGKPDKEAKVAGRVEGGTLGAFKHTAKGIYEATFTPEDSDSPGTASITVGIEGDDKQIDTLSIELMPRRATELAVTTDPAEIGPGDEAVALRVLATGSNGKPVPGQMVHVAVTGGKAREVSEKGEGSYETTVGRDADTVKIGVVATGAPSNNPVAHVLVLPARDRIDDDGASAVDVVVVTTDVFGYPVPGVEVELGVEGDAKLPAKTKTNDYGFSRLELTAGKSTALIAIDAKAGPARGAGAVLQGGKRKALKGMPVGVSASKEVGELVKSWQGATANVRLKVDTNGPPPVPAYELAAKDAETATLEVAFWPKEIPPGGEATIRAIPLDASGKKIPAKTLDVLTSAGKLGETTESDAVYETTLTVGKDASGEAKVSVVAPSGVMKLVKIPINPDAVVAAAGADDEDDGGDAGYADGGGDDADATADAAADAGTGDKPEEKPEEAKPEKPPKEPKQPKDSAEHPWLRAGVKGLGSVYRYAQNPSDEPGPLIPSPLTVGDGSPPATPVGFEIGGRAWHPDIPYVGAIASFRTSYYAIASDAFGGNAPDWLYDVNVMAAGRYPFDVGADQFWVGGKAGLRYDDFMLFQGCLNPGCQVEFAPLGMVGLGLGAEVGAEIDAADLYFIGGYTHGLANFSIPYMHGVDVTAGYAFIENATVDVGMSWVSRKIALQGADSDIERGTLSDSQLVFKLGAGVQF